jgi:hypothetical protein
MSNCFQVRASRTWAKEPRILCPGYMMDGSRTSICVKSFQTPKLPKYNKLVDNLWISRSWAPGARPVRSCQGQTPKLPKNLTNPPLSVSPGSGSGPGPGDGSWANSQNSPETLCFLRAAGSAAHVTGIPASQRAARKLIK